MRRVLTQDYQKNFLALFLLLDLSFYLVGTLLCIDHQPRIFLSTFTRRVADTLEERGWT